MSNQLYFLPLSLLRAWSPRGFGSSSLSSWWLCSVSSWTTMPRLFAWQGWRRSGLTVTAPWLCLSRGCSWAVCGLTHSWRTSLPWVTWKWWQPRTMCCLEASSSVSCSCCLVRANWPWEFFLNYCVKYHDVVECLEGKGRDREWETNREIGKGRDSEGRKNGVVERKRAGEWQWRRMW